MCICYSVKSLRPRYKVNPDGFSHSPLFPFCWFGGDFCRTFPSSLVDGFLFVSFSHCCFNDCAELDSTSLITGPRTARSSSLIIWWRIIDFYRYKTPIFKNHPFPPHSSLPLFKRRIIVVLTTNLPTFLARLFYIWARPLLNWTMFPGAPLARPTTQILYGSTWPNLK